MITQPAHSRCRFRRRTGITLVESVVSVIIVGVMLVTALNTVAMARKEQRSVSDRGLGKQLAMGLMNEILCQAYMNTNGVDVFGLEPGKSNANRSQFTDVDDYNGWTESPPQDRSGNPLSGTTGWTRSVSVVWADPRTWQPSTFTNTGLKMITVNCLRNGVQIASVVAYRSAAWVDTIPTPSDTTSHHPPVAVATASRTTNGGSLTTTLDASGSTDQDGNPLSFVWNFGDGTSGSGPTLTHTYTAVGTYTATVTVYDGHGGVATASVVLTVTVHT